MDDHPRKLILWYRKKYEFIKICSTMTNRDWISKCNKSMTSSVFFWLFGARLYIISNSKKSIWLNIKLNLSSTLQLLYLKIVAIVDRQALSRLIYVKKLTMGPQNAQNDGCCWQVAVISLTQVWLYFYFIFTWTVLCSKCTKEWENIFVTISWLMEDKI